MCDNNILNESTVPNYTNLINYWMDQKYIIMQQMGESYWVPANDDIHICRGIKLLNAIKVWIEHKFWYKCIEDKIRYYKSRVKKIRILWTLHDDYVSNLFQSKCFYCDADPDMYFNNLDRININCDFTNDNVVSACFKCACIKGCIDIDVFFKRCEHILTNLKLINGDLHNDVYNKTISMTHAGYQNYAQRKHIHFNITEDDFNNIVIKNCYLCGTPTHNSHLNGINLFDPTQGYTINNCRSCCETCDKMKNTYSYDEFVNTLMCIYNKHKQLINEWKERKEFVIMSGELALYRYANSLGYFVRSNLYFADVAKGLWSYKYSYNDIFFEMTFKSSKPINRNNVEIINVEIDSEFHNMPYLTLCQSHVELLDYKNNMLSKNISGIRKTHDSTLVIEVPLNNKKISITITKYEEKIINIAFAYDSKINGYCKCSSCASHNIDFNTDDEIINYCHCDNCMNHYMHEAIDNCFWCTSHDIINQNKCVNYKNDDFVLFAKKRIANRITFKENKDNVSNFLKQIREKTKHHNDAAYQKSRATIIKYNLDEKTIEENRKKDAAYMRDYRKKNNKSIKVKKTPEEVREASRLRKQKSRQMQINE